MAAFGRTPGAHNLVFSLARMECLLSPIADAQNAVFDVLSGAAFGQKRPVSIKLQPLTRIPRMKNSMALLAGCSKLSRAHILERQFQTNALEWPNTAGFPAIASLRQTVAEIRSRRCDLSSLAARNNVIAQRYGISAASVSNIGFF